jgi:hypothetical protein
MKRILLILGMISIAAVSSAQQKETSKSWRFRSILNLGLLEGETGSSFQIQTINGAAYKSWFGGIGLGIDYYRYRTIPLFADIRKEFGQAKNKPFVYSDMGISFCWLTDNQKMGYRPDNHFNNGFYGDWGVGYKMAAGKNNAVMVSLGYSYKKITETYPTYYGWFPPVDDITRPQVNDPPKGKINYSLNRLSIKIGWQF